MSAASADLSALDASELKESALDESDEEDESSLDLAHTTRYDMIRDTVLTCARKPT